MIIFPITYILLLAVTILQAYRKERKRKPVHQSAKVAPPQEEQPLPSCFTIEWDLENGGSKITVDE
jgi:hypothetical protein